MSLSSSNLTAVCRASQTAPDSTINYHAGDLVLHFDGSCQRNPGGPGGWAWRLSYPSGDVAAFDSGALPAGPHVTCNVAEWTGLLAGLEYLATNPGFDRVTVRGDSKLVIQQAAGRWGVKAPKLRPLVRRFRDLVRRIGAERLTFEWIPRNENKACDAISRPCEARPNTTYKSNKKTKVNRGKSQGTHSRWFKPGRKWAMRSRFRLRESLGPNSVVWGVVDKATGKEMAKYLPRTGAWLGTGVLSGKKGFDQSFRLAFEKLRRLIATHDVAGSIAKDLIAANALSAGETMNGGRQS